jgi:hypothetical protein
MKGEAGLIVEMAMIGGVPKVSEHYSALTEGHFLNQCFN